MNAKKALHDYRVGDQILKKRYEWSKLGKRWDGPYVIKWVHVNGNVTVKLRARVTKSLNIRRIETYHKPTV